MRDGPDPIPAGITSHFNGGLIVNDVTLYNEYALGTHPGIERFFAIGQQTEGFAMVELNIE